MNTEAGSSKLFVYGTLLLDVPSPMSRFLQGRIISSREVTIPGYLYDLGRYPGLVYDAAASDRVYGQVLELREPQATFQVLDEYEGLHEAPAEYARTLLTIGSAAVWAYTFLGSTGSLPRISSGDYRQYFRQQQDHLRFISGK